MNANFEMNGHISDKQQRLQSTTLESLNLRWNSVSLMKNNSSISSFAVSNRKRKLKSNFETQRLSSKPAKLLIGLILLYTVNNHSLCLNIQTPQLLLKTITENLC